MKNINCIYIGPNTPFVNYGQTGKASKKNNNKWIFYPDGEPNSEYEIFVNCLYFPRY